MAETKERNLQFAGRGLVESVLGEHPETAEATEEVLSELTRQFDGTEADLQNLDDVFLDGSSVDSLPSPGKVVESIDELIDTYGRTIFDKNIDGFENQRAAAMVFYCRFEYRMSLDETVHFLWNRVSRSIDTGYVLQWQLLGLEAISRHQASLPFQSPSDQESADAGNVINMPVNGHTVKTLGNLIVGRDGVLPAWREEARCLDGDPEAFFPDKGIATKEAKRMCETCPVQQECLDWALENNERFGVWGGLSEQERNRLSSRKAG